MVGAVPPAVTDSLWREAHRRVIAAGELRRLADGHFTPLLIRLVLAVDVSVAHPVPTNAFPYGAEKTNALQRTFLTSLTLCVVALQSYLLSAHFFFNHI